MSGKKTTIEAYGEGVRLEIESLRNEKAKLAKELDEANDKLREVQAYALELDGEVDVLKICYKQLRESGEAKLERANDKLEAWRVAALAFEARIKEIQNKG